MKSVFIIGGTTYDSIVYLNQLPQPVPHTIHQSGFFEGIGSTGAGKALALTKLNVPNSLYSVVGNDIYGERIRKTLKDYKVNFLLDEDIAGTERHVNLMDKEGNRISVFVTQSSEKVEYNFTAIENEIKQCDIIVLNIIAYCRHLIPVIQKYNKPVWTDLHDYDGVSEYHQDFINAAQYIHLSSDNLTDYRSTMQELINRGKEMVICTHGKQGASLLTKQGEWLEQEAITNMNIVDSNGAGDSFFSGFLFGFMQNKPLQTCLKYGALCGAYCVTNHELVYKELSAYFLEKNS